MKVALTTKKGDFSIELSTAEDRLSFAESVSKELTEKDFVTAEIIEPEGTARFSSAASLVRALERYED